MTGPSHIVEGEMGFQKQVSGPFVLPGRMGGEQGEGFMINRTYIKFWPAEYHSQSAIDAALQLRPDIGNLDDIERIDVDTFNAAVDIIGGEEEKWFPKSRETADHSMPYCIAAALVDGNIGLEQFDDAHLTDPRIGRLIQKTRMHRDAELDKRYPEGIPNRLRITMKDEQQWVKEVTFPRGHAQNPMSDQEVEDKVRNLAEHRMMPEPLTVLLQRLMNLEQVADISMLLQSIRC
jgi:2-methylcitrate dehydratase